MAANSSSSVASTNSPPPRLKNFVITEKLGSGSYATVYKAYRKGGERQVVAVKCVLKTSLTKVSTENLLTEIELLKKLKHENIVELKDFEWDSHYIYLMMEYCSGGDLSHFIQSRRKLPENVVKKFLQQIANALFFLRSNNIAHMDLKPQNILLTSVSNPVLKIADFGFAKPIVDGMELIIMRGSPLYMAPEIVCNGHYDARVDIWSLGVILYECLFGQAPFASNSFKELGEKIWDTKPVVLPYGVSISDDCRDLLQMMLKRRPEDRITFDAFFNHPFVDLDHVPTEESLPRAKSLVEAAVNADQSGAYKQAVKLYCQALDYFVPAIHFEKDSRRKDILRKKVREYMERAEELKMLMKPSHTSLTKSKSNNTGSYKPDEIEKLCNDSAELAAAIKLIKVAEYEVEKEKFDAALEHYEMALGAVIKILPVEPKGSRKAILKQAVDRWFKEAEKIKSYLVIQKLNTTETTQLDEENQKTYTSQCRVQ